MAPQWKSGSLQGSMRPYVTCPSSSRPTLCLLLSPALPPSFNSLLEISNPLQPQGLCTCCFFYLKCSDIHTASSLTLWRYLLKCCCLWEPAWPKPHSSTPILYPCPLNWLYFSSLPVSPADTLWICVVCLPLFLCNLYKCRNLGSCIPISRTAPGA